MRRMFRRPPKTVIVPFDIGEFRAGDRVEWLPFMTRLSVLVSQLEQEREAAEEENEALLDMIDERDYKIDELREEVDGLHYDIENYYKPVNPYEEHGVMESDFR